MFMDVNGGRFSLAAGASPGRLAAPLAIDAETTAD
jgi:hypothetical protein